jgi:hypothetical protein
MKMLPPGKGIKRVLCNFEIWNKESDG